MIKNIILISIDTLRYDCIGYQPDKKELLKHDVLKYLETPTLDEIAEKSLCFTQCISTNTYTTAAHASVFTGLYPPAHGVREFYGKKLTRNVHTLAEILKVYGYTTVMSVDNINHFGPTDLKRGFDHVIIQDDDALFKLLKTIKNENDSRHFVFVHFFDVHEPYGISENHKYNDGYYLHTMESLYQKFNLPFKKSLFREESKYVVWDNLIHNIGRKFEVFMPLYIQGVNRFDSGRFKDFITKLQKLGCMEDSLIIIFSDHGEGRRDDKNPDCFGHAGPLFDNVIRVPLILYNNDIKPGLTDKLVSLVDIFPTILESTVDMSLKELLPYGIDGFSLFQDQKGKRQVYSETWIMDCNDKHWNLDMASSLLYQRALRSDSHKYIIYGRPERFEGMDLSAGSDEDLLRNYYRCLLCEFEPYHDFIEKLHALKEKSITREHLIHSDNKRSYCYYDFGKDPVESHPVFLSGEIPQSIRRYFQEILMINERTSETEDIFENVDSEFLREIVKKLFLIDYEQFILTLSNNKHLINELIDKTILNLTISDEEFVKRIYQIFLGSTPNEKELREDIELLRSGLSRRSFFNSKVFNRRAFREICFMRDLHIEKENTYARLMELEEVRYRYEQVMNSLMFKIFNKIKHLIDNVLFPARTKRGHVYLYFLEKLRRS